MYLKIICFILISYVLTWNAEAWLMHAVYHNDAYAGKCFVNENLILTAGQAAKSPAGCSEIHCRNENGHAEIVGCSKVMSPTNCVWDGLEDENASFPLCCIEKFVCDSPADEEDAKKLQDYLRDMFKQQVKEKKRQ